MNSKFQVQYTRILHRCLQTRYKRSPRVVRVRCFGCHHVGVISRLTKGYKTTLPKITQSSYLFPGPTISDIP